MAYPAKTRYFSFLAFPRYGSRIPFVALAVVLWFSVGAMALLLICSGCAESKESLHELDHHQPVHWPRNLFDASSKIRKRVLAVNSEDESVRRTAANELRDLIAWAPEVAADTDLPEEQWLPIYTASEDLRPKVAKQISLTDDTAMQIESLCVLLDSAARAL